MNRLRFVWVSVLGSLLLLTPRTTRAGWTRIYGGEGWERGHCVQQTDDEGYIIAGYTGSFGAGMSDLWLLKTDSTGDTIWTRTYGREKDDQGYSVRETNDGGYIIAGFTQALDTALFKLWLLKTKENGDTIWTKEYDGGKGYCLEQTSDDGYILVGYSWSSETGMDLWLLKTDSLGDTLWTRTYGGVDLDWGTHVDQTRDGGYVVTGYTRDSGARWYDLWLLKMDASGDTVWTRRYGGRWEDIGECVQETNDGGYVITGVTTVDSTGAGDLLEMGLWLLKTDTLGDTVWTRTYGGWEFNAYGHYVQETHDGGYIVTGWMRSSEQWDNVWLLKTDAEGDTLWTRSYGGRKSDEGYCVQQTDDGGYIITGSTESFGAGLSDLWLIKTDANGDTLAVVEEPVGDPGGGWDLVTSVGSQIVLQYSDCPEGFHASVFDATGRKVDVLQSSAPSGTITWGEDHNPGVYFIVPSEGKASVQKVILIK